MSRKLCTIMFCLFLLLNGSYLTGQNIVSLKGVVYNASTGEKMIGATVHHLSSNIGVVTDQSGQFNLPVAADSIEIRISYIGFVTKDTIIDVQNNEFLTVSLQPKPIEGETVVVSARKGQIVESTLMGKVEITSDQLNQLPSMMGESDIVRAFELTPGIQPGSDLGSGFYVRGGNTDQNLVLLDNAKVYNPGHALGFFSVFNQDIISGATLYKSGISSQYGGKLSAVLDIKTDMDIYDSIQFLGSIGLIASRATVKTPLIKSKLGMSFSYRRTYLDLLVKPLVEKTLNLNSTLFGDYGYFFQDINVGMSYKGKKDVLDLNIYTGGDLYDFYRKESDFKNDLAWGNTLGSLNWRHTFNSRLYYHQSASYSKYKFNLSGSQSDYSFSLRSKVNDYTLTGKLNHFQDNHTISMGYELAAYVFSPNKIDAEGKSISFNFNSIDDYHSRMAALFIEDQWKVSEKIKLSIGVRYSWFRHLGPFKEFQVSPGTELDSSIIFKKGEEIATYHQPEPRISARYQLNATSSLKASYMNVAQYVHLATSSSVSLPTDIWLPSTKGIKPQNGHQVSLGYYRIFKNETYALSYECFYKQMNKQLEFVNGIINNSINMTLLENIVVGQGYSFGGELFFQKKLGDFTGWISYTLSRSLRRFNELNDGDFYPSKYDRIHNLSLTAMYQLNNKWKLSAIFVYYTGSSLTVPVGRYIIAGNVINEYGKINNFRLPPYHRLDASISRTLISRQGWQSELQFSVYNLYNRANIFFVYYDVKGDLRDYDLSVKARPISLFPVIPSISWRFKF